MISGRYGKKLNWNTSDMECPICKTKQLEIKNGYYFCPVNNIFLEKVKPEQKVPNNLVLVNGNQVTPPIQVTNNPKIINDEPTRDWLNLYANYTKKGFFLFLVILLIFNFIQNFIYFDSSNGCFIKILPSWDMNFNQEKIKQSLNVLKNALPDDYKNVCQRIKTIDPNLDCGRFEGGCYWPGDPTRISISVADQNLGWSVGVIVHETCHTKQDSDHRPFSEAECHKEDDRVLKSLSVF